jgi:hypothetical protein
MAKGARAHWEVLAVGGAGMTGIVHAVIAQGKRRGGPETRAGRRFSRSQKENPAGLGPRGEIRQSRKEMALPAKRLVSRCWQPKYYLFVKVKAILLFCFVNI